MSQVKDKKAEIRALAEADLEVFIKLVHPDRVLGSIHQDVIRWWHREGAKSHQLILLPRDHQKSALIAYRVAWEITKNPAIRVLYISSTSNLATKQLKFIKDILTCERYRYYWPEMVSPDEGRREKWTETEISVDHPLRKKEFIRDPTIFTAGLTTNIAGLHADISVMDDIVVSDNAYTEEGREKTKQQYSLLASIEGTNARGWVVGTRYHQKDLYSDLAGLTVRTLTPDGEIGPEIELYDKFEAVVESSPLRDGTGEFLWPKQRRHDGREFGFDYDILERKRAQYLDKVQFYAQYYNDPNDPTGGGVRSEYFQYYDRAHLKREDGHWYMKGRRLNVFASVDFAFSLKVRADYSCICVVGIDKDNNFYILDIARFKAVEPSAYFDEIFKLYRKWEFRKLRAEVTVAQQALVNSLKLDYVRVYGLALQIEEFRPTRHMGNKEERVSSILQPRYANRQIWHYKGGHCQTLEEELILSKPPHDDVKDALASCIDSCKAPTGFGFGNRLQKLLMNREITHARYGGVA